ncbi:MAG: HNH endonuclease [Nocardioides sp.]
MDRAHLVDHALGGSAEPSNLVPLCLLCHDAMTARGGFADRALALTWVSERETEMFQPALWQVFTDSRGKSHASRSRKAHLLRLRGDYLQLCLDVLQEQCDE